MPGPFGPRPLVYADYTASGRALGMIEGAIQRDVLPYYGNTHTDTSFTGMHTTRLRESARLAIRDAVGAAPEHAVIFAGSGTTAAIDRFSRILGLQDTDQPDGVHRPVVFIGPFEHHSNDLAWRESGVDLVRIPLDEHGVPCLATLDARLQEYADRRRKVVSFSVASNVTGVVIDVRRLASLVHRHGGIVACDYAAGGPYMPIDMAASAPDGDDHLDALFLSPHKFIGGPGTSGVLVIRRELCTNEVPGVAGGGTVAYVTADEHRYVDDPQRREEGGTPGIVENIRTGLVFALKSQVGAQHIAELEATMVDKAMARWAQRDNLHLLGPLEAPRLGIFSFNLSAGSRMIHHNLVVAMLNDLFGIQARGGCSCAGPYGHELLDIDDEQARRHADLVQEGKSLYRPGWARLGFNYFFDDETVDYIIDAVDFIARHAAELMRLYSVDMRSGVWRASDAQPLPETPSLAELLSPCEPRQGMAPPPDFAQCFRQAQALLETARATDIDATPPPLGDAEDALRWFWLPHEADRAAGRAE
ncbi:aminotransferase class V-fold PLP-dependent enzyme [Halomonas borealis]|uniref:aminotransferase class V-fold PLP-dependent enzyme n=1 Tax=Halomonas borealis TaxID=2508710 RepID=UPI0010A0642A|nr:aminotransferase class V-fold PLP-dependent enzyme [Halomonas borealis]